VLRVNPPSILVPLTKDQLVTSSKGKNGGTQLAKAAELITLKDIYLSVIGEKKIWEA
jgi:Rrf2 family transcriptional repressor of oqxAB